LTGHDCEYVRQRNAFFHRLSPVANSFVDVVTPGEGNDEAVTESRVKWTRCFSIAMDELAKPLLNGTGK
jgi:hypothetical protein